MQNQQSDINEVIGFPKMKKNKSQMMQNEEAYLQIIMLFFKFLRITVIPIQQNNPFLLKKNVHLFFRHNDIINNVMYTDIITELFLLVILKNASSFCTTKPSMMHFII